MKRTSKTPRIEAPASSFQPPYAASGLERLRQWVERLPGPFWLFYLFIGLLLMLVQSAFHWSVGVTPPWTWGILHALISILIPGALLLIHVLDRLAERSFDAFRPVLSATAREASVLRYILTTMPRGATIAAVGGFIVFGFVMFIAPGAIDTGISTGLTAVVAAAIGSNVDGLPAGGPLAFNLLFLVLTWAITGAFVFHTVRQLVWVSRIYARHTRVDLLAPGPLYALSRVSTATAIGLIVLVYLILVADRQFFHDPRNLVGAVIFGLLAVLAFVLPLLGIHRLLAEEKARLLNESSERLKAALAELHRRVDGSDLRRMDDLNKAITSLEAERSLLGRIPTWPWQPETLRTVIGALLLPLVLWLAQAILGRWLIP
jgi:hypothetical protein